MNLTPLPFTFIFEFQMVSYSIFPSRTQSCRQSVVCASFMVQQHRLWERRRRFNCKVAGKVPCAGIQWGTKLRETQVRQITVFKPQYSDHRIQINIFIKTTLFRPLYLDTIFRPLYSNYCIRTTYSDHHIQTIVFRPLYSNHCFQTTVNRP